jgi:hypothetical protein
MSTRVHETLRKNGVTVLNWLMFAMSFATIAWISFRTTGG